jgi:putative transposase
MGDAMNRFVMKLFACSVDKGEGSYQANAHNEPSRLVTPHPLYLALTANSAYRQSAYRDLFRVELESGLADQIRTATNGGFVLGNDRFKQEVAEALKRRVAPGKPGRRRKGVSTVLQATLAFT